MQLFLDAEGSSTLYATLDLSIDPLMSPPPFSLLLTNTGLFYSATLPITFLCLFSLLLIPSFLKGEGTHEDIASAAYCYLLQGFGIFLMTLGGLPTISAVLGRLSLPPSTYLALLLLFIGGGLIYLWHDYTVSQIDERARRIPFTIYFHTLKLLGFLITTFSILSILLIPLLKNTEIHRNWWVLPLTLLLYGLLLSWATRVVEPPPPPSRGKRSGRK